jgi:acyl-CoA thioesterase-1
VSVKLACLIVLLSSACSEPSPFETSSHALQVAAPNAEATEPTLPAITLSRAGLLKVVFLGDSIAAGQYLTEPQAFPSVVERRLRASGVNFALINASVSTDTTQDGLRRVDWILKQQPEVVVIELGENDKKQALPVSEVEANLRAILTKVKAAHATPLLLGMTGEPEHAPDRASALAYARDFEAMYPRLAAELDVPFVPRFMQGVAGRRELTLPDRIHPTPEGHERVASNIVEPLRALLTE